MSIDLMTVVWKMTGLSSTEKMVLLALADAANDDGVTWMAIKSKRAGKLDFIRKTALSERTVQTCMKKLEEMGFLHREFRDGKGTIYTVTPEGCESCGGARDSKTPAGDAPKPSNKPDNIKRPTRRCPEDWKPNELDLSVGKREGLDASEIDRCLAMFRDHTFSASRSDWSATFRNWLRKAGDMKRREGRFTGKAFTPAPSKPDVNVVSPELLARHQALMGKD